MFLLPTFRQPSISCNILQLFDYLCHYSHGHLLSIRLGIRCLSCSITFWLSQTSCFLSAHMHSCYSCTPITHADCHMFNYCFSFHTSPLCKFLPSALSAYQHSACFILFPVHTSLLLSTNVYYTLSLYYFCCFLLGRSAMHSYCPLHTHCLLTTQCALVIHSTLVTSSSPVASHCFLVAVRTLPTLGTLPFAHGPPRSMHLYHL